MSRGSKKTAVWYNGRKYVWDDLRAEFVRWIRNRFGRPVCKSYRDDLARMTSNEAAQFVGNAVERRKNGVLHFTSVPRKKAQLVPDKKPGRCGYPPYPMVNGEMFTPAKSVEEAIQYARNLGVDASEYYNNVELYIANAINAELWQAKELFEDKKRRNDLLDVIRIIKPIRFHHKGFFNSRVLGTYVVKNSTIRLKVRRSVFSNKKMDRDDWYDVADNGGASTNDWRHVFRHEIGHAIERYIQKNFPVTYGVRLEKISTYLRNLELSVGEKLFNQYMGQFSRLANTHSEDIIAECFAHVLGNGCNQLALDIIGILTEGMDMMFIKDKTLSKAMRFISEGKLKRIWYDIPKKEAVDACCLPKSWAWVISPGLFTEKEIETLKKIDEFKHKGMPVRTFANFLPDRLRPDDVPPL